MLSECFQLASLGEWSAFGSPPARTPHSVSKRIFREGVLSAKRTFCFSAHFGQILSRTVAASVVCARQTFLRTPSHRTMSASAPEATISATPIIRIKADEQLVAQLKPKSGDLKPSAGKTALFVGEQAQLVSRVACELDCLWRLQAAQMSQCIRLPPQSCTVLQLCASCP